MVPQDVPAKKVLSSSRAWEALTPELSQWILDAVSSMGFDRMTPVQASCIPLFIGNKDVVVEAVTGSGKTLAFLIPIIEKILRLDERTKKHHVATIVVSPTTELARQIHTVLSSLLAFHGASTSATRSDEDDLQQETVKLETTDASYTEKTPVVLPQLVVAGQVSPKEDLRWFLQNSPNVLIATPGRLLELLSSPHVHCPQSTFEMLVLDEADRLLDMGFKNDLQKIIAKLPKQRRTGLFSATVGEAVDQIVRVGLRNPVKIAVKVRGLDGKEDQKTPASLQMSYMVTPASQKMPAVFSILSNLDPLPYKTIIYLSTCAAVDYWQHILPSLLPSRDGHNFLLVPLHGKQQQKIRQKNFTRFANAASPAVLLTTDVAARGLDIPQVDVVLQIDPPSDPKVFLHRCGRAGRAGRKGLSILFLQPGREEDYLTFLEIRRTPLSLFALPDREDMGREEAQTDITTERIRTLVKADRALHEQAQRAFVSWVQSYSKHQASSIFRVQDQDWEDLARAWGLLNLPKMPELKTLDVDRSLGLDIDWDDYKFKDKAREQARQKALLEFRASETTVARKHNKRDQKRSWSEKHGGQEVRVERREKRQKKRDNERDAKMTAEEQQDQHELNDLIAQVRRQNQLAGAEFEGFAD